MEERISTILNYHEKEFSSKPSVLVSCPGRVNLMGDFTEYSQGYSLSMTIEQRVYVGVSPRQDGQIRFSSREYNEKKKTIPGNLKFRKEDRWANIPKGALSLVYPQLSSDQGLDISVASDIPQSMGLGSSQALALASVLAFSEYFKLYYTREQVLTIALLVETQFLGLPTGASAFRVFSEAQRGNLLLLDHRSGDVESLPLRLSDGQIYIFNSRVPSASFESPSPGDLKDLDLVARFLSRGRIGKTLRDFTRSDLRDKVGDIPESSRRRSLHVVEENLRVFEMRNLIENQDWQSFSRLMSRSHESLRDLYEVSCPEVDWLVKRLGENSAFWGSRFTSTGTGGTVITIGHKNALESFSSQMEEYERIFGFHIEVLLTEPSEGVLIHKV